MRQNLWQLSKSQIEIKFYHRQTAVRPMLMATSQSNGNGQTSAPHRIQSVTRERLAEYVK